MNTFDLLGRVDEKGNLTLDYPVVDFPAGLVRVVLTITPFDEKAAEQDWHEIISSVTARWIEPEEDDLYSDVDGGPDVAK